MHFSFEWTSWKWWWYNEAKTHMVNHEIFWELRCRLTLILINRINFHLFPCNSILFLASRLDIMDTLSQKLILFPDFLENRVGLWFTYRIFAFYSIDSNSSLFRFIIIHLEVRWCWEFKLAHFHSVYRE